jgi:hypothetical protein
VVSIASWLLAGSTSFAQAWTFFEAPRPKIAKEWAKLVEMIGAGTGNLISAYENDRYVE